VIPAAGQPVSEVDVLEYARTYLANFKVPRFVWIVDALPVNSTGKVLKHELRARHHDLCETG